jgi:signal-transduction protein with cAMP-binding, CBS, and nucleotidyltransferase domain
MMPLSAEMSGGMRALSITQVCDLVPRPHANVDVGDPMWKVVEAMKSKKRGAVLVTEEGKLVGIFTERDALFRVMAANKDPKKTLVREVMTADPITVSPDETFGYALLIMHEKGFRHTPVVEDGRPVGVISAHNALDPDLEEFAAEAERRKAIRRRAA